MAQAWKLRIQSASFRGIPFQVYMAGGSLGRSTALHVFPNGSAPYPEDLGKAPQFYDVQGFVSGSSYMTQRDALEAAFQQPGPGTLVHPWYGSLYVALAGPVRTQHSAVDGGLWQFQARFVRVEKPGGLTGAPNLLDMVAERVSAVAERARALADSVGQYLDKGAWVVSQIETAAGVFISSVKSVLALPEGLSTLAGMAGSTGWLTGMISSGSFGASCWNMVQTGAENLPSGSGPTALLDLVRSAPQVTASEIFGTSRRAAAEGQRIVSNVQQQMCAAAACSVAAAYAPSTTKEAGELQASVLDAIDAAQMEADDETFAALSNLRTVTLRSMAEKARTLPDVISVTESQVMPSLAVVWRWTGGLEAEQELVARNGLRHPGFVPGGQALELIHG
ncbi:DNA circularization protein [uncultured Mailhella sp.]|uniref:DNA circularization protein n=1 Tax=uncultured Mailhella sp. TaxID=1981031 RepID=UPI0025F86B7F|nr:DNA circularization N-terminal domain-containing protein [uncultured Mailhella sp.]